MCRCSRRSRWEHLQERRCFSLRVYRWGCGGVGVGGHYLACAQLFSLNVAICPHFLMDVLGSVVSECVCVLNQSV
jgi:hypothetical protein